jgi:hypothetical protein
MTNHTADRSLRIAARFAGFMYIFGNVTGIFAAMFVRSSLVVPGNATETAKNIMASEQLFRIGAVTDVISSALIVGFALALYILLKPVNKNLALLGLFWRLGEAFMLGVFALSSYIVLLLVSGAAYSTAFESDQLHALVLLFSDAHETGFNIALIFVGLGTTVFNYLFFKSNYIPKALAGFGIFASVLMLIGTFAILILPTPSEMLDLLPYMPGLVFEVTIGLWLLIKGVNIQERDNRALESA